MNRLTLRGPKRVEDQTHAVRLRSDWCYGLNRTFRKLSKKRSVRLSHHKWAKLIDSAVFRPRHIQTLPTRTAINGAKYVKFPGSEESSRFARMSSENSSVTAGGLGKTASYLLPGRIRSAPIDMRLRRSVMRVSSRGSCRNDNIIPICRIDRNTPQVVVLQPLFETLPLIAAVTALKITVTSRRIQAAGRRVMG
jgi:hypothetical protein